MKLFAKFLVALSLASASHLSMAQAVQGEIGSYPNATPLVGNERILADQSLIYPCISCTVNLTPAQISAFLAGSGNLFPAYTTGFLQWNGTSLQWATPPGTGTVTSIGLSMPIGFSVSPGSITTSGTLSVSTSLSGILKGSLGAFTTATAGDVGGLLYPTSAAETSASVTPTNFNYPWMDVRRYGQDCTGATASATPLQTAITVAAVSGGLPLIESGCTVNLGTTGITLASNAPIWSYGATVNYSGTGVMITSPQTGSLNYAGILGGVWNAGSSSTKILELYSPYKSTFGDFVLTSTSTTNTAIDILVNTSGTADPDGKYNAVFNTFRDILLDGTHGRGMRLIGNATGPVVVTLNRFYNVSESGTSGQGSLIASVDLNSWTDNNSWFGSRLYVAGVTNANGVGLIENSGTPASDVGVYTNNFYDLSIDCLGTVTGDTRVGAVFNLAKLGEIRGYYQGPTCAGGAYTMSRTQNTSLNWYSGTFGRMDFDIRQLTGAPSTPVNNYISPYNYYIASDTADTQTNGNGNLIGLSVEDALGAGFTGGREAIQGRLIITGSPGGTLPVPGYVGVSGITSSAFNLGGTNLSSYTNSAGGMFGGNFNCFTASGATFLTLCNGAEFDSTLVAGSSAADHFGLTCVEASTQAVRGTFDDACFEMSNQNGTTNDWHYGVSFGGYAHHWPFDADSTLIGAQLRQVGGTETDNALNGVDFRNVTFASGGKAFASPGFAVDNIGNINSAPASGTATITAAGVASSAAQIVAAGNGNAASAALIISQTATNLATINNKANAGLCFDTNNAQALCVAASGAVEALGTTFTVNTGTGGCSSTSTLVGSQQGGSLLCTGTAGASTVTIVLPTVSHIWACWANDDTSGVPWGAKSAGSSGVTLVGTLATSGDKVTFGCLGN